MMKKNGTIDDAAARYQREWREMMVRIWTDRIRRVGAIRSGTLLESVSAGAARYGLHASFAFQFVRYGVYVDSGRYNHETGAKVERRPWFSHSWRISRRVMANQMGRIYGDAFVALFDNLGE